MPINCEQKHPPIPPKCDLLMSGGTFVYILATRMGPPYTGRDYTIADIGPNKQIAAAIGRSAWLDEAERISTHPDFVPQVSIEDIMNDRIDAATKLVVQEHEHAMKNADAWKHWASNDKTH